MQNAVCLSLEKGSNTLEISFDPFQLKNLFIYSKFII